MGSPAMNLVRARLDGRHAVIGHQRLRLTDPVLARRPSLAGYDGREIVVGLRPESFAQSPNGPVADRTLELDVVLTEALGSDLLVHADIDAPVVLTADQAELAEEVVTATLSRMTLRLPPGAAVRAGERVRAIVDVERLHFFDPDTEGAIR